MGRKQDAAESGATRDAKILDFRNSCFPEGSPHGGSLNHEPDRHAMQLGTPCDTKYQETLSDRYNKRHQELGGV